MLFPNPEFLQDKNSAQYLFFVKFVGKLKKDFFALSPTAFDEMLDNVSDCCEAFYQIDLANDNRKESNILLKKEMEGIKIQLQKQVA